MDNDEGAQPNENSDNGDLNPSAWKVMNGSKEVVVVVLDVSMRWREAAVSSIGTFLHSVILFSPKCEIGLYFYGTQETRNALNHEMEEREIKGQYLHVIEIQPIRHPMLDDLSALEEIPKETAAPDTIDALTVATDQLKRHLDGYDAKNKVSRKILIMSEFANTEKLVSPAFCMELERNLVENDITIEAIVVTIDDQISHRPPDLTALTSLKTASVTIKEVTSVWQLLSVFPAKLTNGASSYKGPFTMSESCHINIRVYKKTQRERLPSCQVYSPNLTKTVEWKNAEDPSEAIPEDRIIRAYAYGAEDVPLSEEEEKNLMYKPEKGIQLIGFIKQCQVPRHHYLKDTFALLPDIDDGSKRAWGALAEACRREDKAMLVRAVLRNNASLFLGVVIPSREAHKRRDVFYMNVIPFSDDIRGFHFGSFANKGSLKPSPEQLHAMEELITHGRLDKESEDLLDTDKIANPTLHRVYKFLGKRARDPESVFDVNEDKLSSAMCHPDFEQFGKEFGASLHRAIPLFQRQKLEEDQKKKEYEDWAFVPKIKIE